MMCCLQQMMLLHNDVYFVNDVASLMCLGKHRIIELKELVFL